jgi:hypothetical protein
MHRHKSHHTMNQMAMGQNRRGDMMETGRPRNTLPMVTGGTD